MATSSLPSTSSSKTIYDSSTAMPFALQQKRQQHRYTDTCLFYPPAFSSRHRHGYVRRYSTTSIDSGMTTTTTRSGHSSLHRKAMSLGTLPLLLQQQNDGLDQFISRRQEGMQHDISSNNSNNNNNMPCKYQLDPLSLIFQFSSLSLSLVHPFCFTLAFIFLWSSYTLSYWSVQHLDCPFHWRHTRIQSVVSTTLANRMPWLHGRTRHRHYIRHCRHHPQQHAFQRTIHDAHLVSLSTPPWLIWVDHGLHGRYVLNVIILEEMVSLVSVQSFP